MTDNEIIKALKCCNEMENMDCIQCPYYSVPLNFDRCSKRAKDTIDLINRQKAEIESLETTYEIVKQEYDDMFSANRNLMAEVERLKDKSIADDKLLNDRVQDAVNSVSKANQKYVDALEKAFNDKVAELKTVKTEAIEELWTKVRAYAVLMGCYHIVEYGDSVVKELVGE